MDSNTIAHNIMMTASFETSYTKLRFCEIVLKLVWYLIKHIFVMVQLLYYKANYLNCLKMQFSELVKSKKSDSENSDDDDDMVFVARKQNATPVFCPTTYYSEKNDEINDKITLMYSEFLSGLNSSFFV
ncbi:hypothetical protein [Carp edema virus]|nr:hypothetical protein [Carp edema virus]